MTNDKVLIHTKVLLAFFSISDSAPSENIYASMKQLRELSFSSELAKEKLRGFLYSEDFYTKIFAAEALSHTKSFPSEVIPVFQAVLEACHELNVIDINEAWCGLSFSSVSRYNESALLAEKNIWEYLYTQNNVNLILAAIKALAKVAKVSTASWTILCILCRHENKVIREFSIDLMKSEDFKNYMYERGSDFSLN